MANLVAIVLTIPLILWTVFQPMMYHNASMTRETIKVAIYEVSKEAAMQGQFDADLYAEFKDMLVLNHGYNPDCIEITGTETLTNRGGELTVAVTVPKPVLSVWDAVTISSCERPDSYTPYTIKQVIKSEYIP